MKPGILAVMLALLAAGCAKRSQLPVRYGVSEDRTFIDLAPGSRLKVVTPLLKSGGFRVKSAVPNEARQGAPVELRADSDFLGYEVAFYEIGPRFRVRPVSVEAMIDGKSELRNEPKVRLFDLPKDVRFLRLVFLTRSSASDHDMAVLSARNFADLEAWTSKLKADPETTCRATKYCSWIPAGIAVTPERR